MRIPLTVPISIDQVQEKVTIAVKSVARDDVNIGSVSISQDLFLSCGESRYNQWITLFDHMDDNEYDGDFGENDEEDPRVQFLFTIEKGSAKSFTPPAATS